MVQLAIPPHPPQEWFRAPAIRSSHRNHSTQNLHTRPQKPRGRRREGVYKDLLLHGGWVCTLRAHTWHSPWEVLLTDVPQPAHLRRMDRLHA